MPRLARSVPKYSKHRASGKAFANLSGVDGRRVPDLLNTLNIVEPTTTVSEEEFAAK